MADSFPPSEFSKVVAEVVASINRLTATKGDEYAASAQDQLANFRRRAAAQGVPMELIWSIYAGKHWDALETYVRDLHQGKQRQRSEPIEGRIDDLILYLILFRAMTKERNKIPVASSYRNHAVLVEYCIRCNEDQLLAGCSRAGCPRQKTSYFTADQPMGE